MQIDQIIKYKEGETVEFKSTFQSDGIETLVAFANTKGGVLYIGIQDDGHIKGVEVGKETIQKWINEIKTKTVPIIIPDVELIDVENKTIVALKIQEYPVNPVSLP